MHTFFNLKIKAELCSSRTNPLKSAAYAADRVFPSVSTDSTCELYGKDFMYFSINKKSIPPTFLTGSLFHEHSFYLNAICDHN